MTSANGYLLDVNGYTLRAYWPAPFYALCMLDGPDDVPDEPLLIHCEDRAHAAMHERRGAIVLDAQFERVA